MFSLCSITPENYAIKCGATQDHPGNIVRDDIIVIGRLKEKLLVLTTCTDEEFVKLESIPAEYEVTFRSFANILDESVFNYIISTLRAEAYPPMADYLDAKVKGDTVAEQTYLNACLAVKAKYPKFSW